MSLITKTKQVLKAKYDSIDNTGLKNNILNAFPFWLGAFITGGVAVIYAYLFTLAESGTVYVYKHASWLFFIITPLCFLLALWVVTKFAEYARGSGIPQVSAVIK